MTELGSSKTLTEFSSGMQTKNGSYRSDLLAEEGGWREKKAEAIARTREIGDKRQECKNDCKFQSGVEKEFGGRTADIESPLIKLAKSIVGDSVLKNTSKLFITKYTETT